MTTPFRTVEYQGSRAQTNAYIKASSGQAAMDSAAEFQQRQLQTQAEATLNNNQMLLRNNERLDALAIDNQRLVAGQMQARNEVVLRNSQLYGEQRLANQRLSSEQQQQIRQLQLTHHMKRAEFDAINKKQESEALTDFGNNLIQFSATLWKNKAEEINKKNLELQALGQMDELLGLGSVKVEDMVRVDQAQYTRLSKQAETELLATRLEKAGLPNDAAKLRADNPWYLYGREEMRIMMGANELPDHIRQVVEQAHQAGPNGEQPLLIKGSGDYSVQLQAVMHTAMKDYLMQSGLATANPTLVSRYLREGVLTAMSGITKQYNSENNKHVREAQQSNALGQALVSAPLLSDPAEASKAISQVINSGGDPKDLLVGLMKQASLTGDDSAVLGVMADPRMAQFLGDYAAWENGRKKEAEAAMKQQNEDNYKQALAEFQQATFQTNPRDIQALKDQFIERFRQMPVEFAAKGEEYIRNYDPNKAGNLFPRLQFLAETNPQAARELMNREGANLTTSQKKEAEALLKQSEKQLTPEAKDAMESAKLKLLGDASPKGNLRAATAMNPMLTQQINAEIKRREELMESRSKRYWMQPGANIQGYREWLNSEANKDLFYEIKLDQFGQVKGLGNGAKPQAAYQGVPSAAIVTHNGRQVTWLTAESSRKAFLRGEYRNVNPYRAVVLTKQEVLAADAEYGRTGVYPPIVLVASQRTGVPAPALLRSQATLLGIKGDLSTYSKPQGSTPAAAPGPGMPGATITKQQAIQRAMSMGLSHRGAIWLATNMLDESSGNPTAVHDGGDGYGLFGHQGGRLTAMKQYATQNGRDISDGSMQLDFALNEIKTKYPSVWRIVTAPNPSLNDLWRASKEWEGFHHSVYDHRYNSLKNALGE